ncbi:MAG TPA: alpha-glucan family phosphorylase [Candidatus Saccharimonadales bacterium]|nr:alpha-glucan family phosphorylase [Candidatus Saccharimonadales bacterium]
MTFAAPDWTPPIRVAYFSMEIALEPGIPTYSGGLGVLAGDTLRAAADRGVDMVGVTLLYRKGYFKQHIDGRGNQSEEPAEWSPAAILMPETPRVHVQIGGRDVAIKAWRYTVRGVRGRIVPVYLLDTALEENDPADRKLTDSLYGGDARYRLSQEIVLGRGGVAMLRALGHDAIGSFHMNEGHSALLALGLMEEECRRTGNGASPSAVLETVRKRCVFTTHTPVSAGHDRFPKSMAREMIGPETAELMDRCGCWIDDSMNMTYLGLFFSHYVNGVSMRHEEISRGMFPGYPISAITNGVHAATWTSDHFQRLFDRHIPQWRHDNLYLRYVQGIPLEEVREAHRVAKRELLTSIERRTGRRLDPKLMTIGFARRAAEYKRLDLLFSDLARLRRIAETSGPFQVLYAGKAHPMDQPGKDLIRRIVSASSELESVIPVVYLEGYDMTLGLKLCAGVDLWLNTPRKPQEASGTSGMKAALNGVPSLSVLDGWWIEGHVEGVTGWSIGEDVEPESDQGREVASLYDKLESKILPLYYAPGLGFASIRRSAIALNGSYFNTQRMLSQYVLNAYTPRD